MVSYTDPYVPDARARHAEAQVGRRGRPPPSACDCALIITDHKVFDYAAIAKQFPLIVDTRNALKGIASEQIFRSDHKKAGSQDGTRSTKKTRGTSRN